MKQVKLGTKYLTNYDVSIYDVTNESVTEELQGEERLTLFLPDLKESSDTQVP